MPTDIFPEYEKNLSVGKRKRGVSLTEGRFQPDARTRNPVVRFVLKYVSEHPRCSQQSRVIQMPADPSPDGGRSVFGVDGLTRAGPSRRHELITRDASRASDKTGEPRQNPRSRTAVGKASKAKARLVRLCGLRFYGARPDDTKGGRNEWGMSLTRR